MNQRRRLTFASAPRVSILRDPAASVIHPRGMEWKDERGRKSGGRRGGEFKNCETPPIIIRRNSFVILMKKEGRFHNDSWKFPVAFINFALHALRNTKNELTLAEITRAPHAFRSRFLSSPTPFRACSPLLPNVISPRPIDLSINL